MKATKNILAAALFVCIAAVGLAGCYGDYWDNAPVLEDCFVIYEQTNLTTSASAYKVSNPYYFKICASDEDDDAKKVTMNYTKPDGTAATYTEYLSSLSQAAASSSKTYYYIPFTFSQTGNWTMTIFITDERSNDSNKRTWTKTVEN